jgi:hypothetical protein
MNEKNFYWSTHRCLQYTVSLSLHSLNTRDDFDSVKQDLKADKVQVGAGHRQYRCTQHLKA